MDVTGIVLIGFVYFFLRVRPRGRIRRGCATPGLTPAERLARRRNLDNLARTGWSRTYYAED